MSSGRQRATGSSARREAAHPACGQPAAAASQASDATTLEEDMTALVMLAYPTLFTRHLASEFVRNYIANVSHVTLSIALSHYIKQHHIDHVPLASTQGTAELGDAIGLLRSTTASSDDSAATSCSTSSHQVQVHRSTTTQFVDGVLQTVPIFRWTTAPSASLSASSAANDNAKATAVASVRVKPEPQREANVSSSGRKIKQIDRFIDRFPTVHRDQSLRARSDAARTERKQAPTTTKQTSKPKIAKTVAAASQPAPKPTTVQHKLTSPTTPARIPANSNGAQTTARKLSNHKVETELSQTSINSRLTKGTAKLTATPKATLAASNSAQVNPPATSAQKPAVSSQTAGKPQLLVTSFTSETVTIPAASSAVTRLPSLPPVSSITNSTSKPHVTKRLWTSEEKVQLWQYLEKGGTYQNVAAVMQHTFEDVERTYMELGSVPYKDKQGNRLFVVAEVLRDRDNSKRRQQEYLVHWAGYASTVDDTWEVRAIIQDTQPYKEYVYKQATQPVASSATA